MVPYLLCHYGDRIFVVVLVFVTVIPFLFLWLCICGGMLGLAFYCVLFVCLLGLVNMEMVILHVCHNSFLVMCHPTLVYPTIYTTDNIDSVL